LCGLFSYWSDILGELIVDTPTVVIELGAAGAIINVYCEPARENFRGRWDRSLLINHGITSGDTIHVPDMPGYHIAANFRDKSIRVYDPLGEKAFRAKARVVADAFAKNGNKQAEISDPLELDDLDQAKFDYWVEWMKACVRAGVARVRDGEFPGDEVKVAVNKTNGRRRTKPLMPGSIAKRLGDDIAESEDE
jgi:hypothetical protein